MNTAMTNVQSEIVKPGNSSGRYLQTMVINSVFHRNFLDNKLPDKCANLIIADPPYYRTKGTFDFVWRNFDDYLKDVELWAVECKRLLAENGTLFWFGGAKNIAYSQVIIDKYFGLLNNLVWENTTDHKQQIRFNEDLRSFAPLTERILMYSNDQYNLTSCVYEVRDYIRSEIQKSKGAIKLKDINHALGTATNGGGVASACLSLEKSEPAMFTKEMYEKLQEWCYPELRRDYEELRRDYEELRRPFDNFMHFGDVIKLPNYETGEYDHDTVKPKKLARILILTCSRKDDLVVVPFAGSGTECAMAAKEGRQFVGYDICKEYVEMSNKRCKQAMSEPTLF